MNNVTSMSVVLPAFNEEQNIANTLSTCLEFLNKRTKNYEVIVVDDGSGDDTSGKVQELRVANSNIILKKHEINLGYGQALKTGLESASKDYIFFMDSDGQFDIYDLGNFIPEISESSIVIGYRYNRADPFIRKLNKSLYDLYLKTVFGLRVKDVDCAFKIFPRNAYLKVRPIKSDGAFFSAELLMKFIKKGYLIKEIPVNHYPRKFGNQTGANLRVILKMFVESFRIFHE